MDAGPNVKVIYNQKDREKIVQYLGNLFSKQRLIISQPGPGVKIIDK